MQKGKSTTFPDCRERLFFSTIFYFVKSKLLIFYELRVLNEYYTLLICAEVPGAQSNRHGSKPSTDFLYFDCLL